MNAELKLKDVWYWGSGFALLFMASVSMYMDNPIPMLAVAIPLILLDRAWIIPVLLFIACIEGSFSSPDSSTKAETYAIMAIGPLFLYDLLYHNKKLVPLNLVMLFLIFGFFVIWGAYIFSLDDDIVQYMRTNYTNATVLVKGTTMKSVMKVIKLGFFFFYLKSLINYDKSVLYRGLTLMKDFVPYLMVCIFADVVLFGHVTSKFDTMHFGQAKHGDFTANLDALGIVLMINIFEKNTSLFKRFVSLCAMAILFYMIMELASRNGLLCLILMGGLGGLVGIWHMELGFKVLIVSVAVAAVGIGFYAFKDSPTIVRAIYFQEERAGGDRMAYWLGGALALQEEPIFGLGGNEVSSIYAVDKYSPRRRGKGHVMHNTFLEFAVEYGLVGVSFYIVFMAVILYHMPGRISFLH
jgi:O-antigen ligase